jgi:mannose-6-phosphate isomerase
MIGDDLRAMERLTLAPLCLTPNRVYRMYRGGALLDRMQGKSAPEDSHFPEEWVGSTTVSRLRGRPGQEGLSKVILPDGSTLVLKSLVEAFPEAMLGPTHVARYGVELGVLCKLLDSAMRLAIQCHPDRSFARKHLGSHFGKTESWIILDTRTVNGVQPYILFGFCDGVTEEEFRRAVKAQDIPAQIAMLNRLEVEKGQVYLVNAGAPHALGPGVFTVEVQEPSDWVVNTEYVSGEIRRTEDQCFMGLGFELGMRCFDFAAEGMEYVRRHMLSPKIILEDEQGREEILIGPQDTPCFGAGRLTVRGRVADRDQGRCYVGIVAEGQGHLTGPGGPVPLRRGTTLFVPAASRHHGYEATPEAPLVVIKCFPPSS